MSLLDLLSALTIKFLKRSQKLKKSVGREFLGSRCFYCKWFCSKTFNQFQFVIQVFWKLAHEVIFFEHFLFFTKCCSTNLRFKDIWVNIFASNILFKWLFLILFMFESHLNMFSKSSLSFSDSSPSIKVFSAIYESFRNFLHDLHGQFLVQNFQL